MTGSGVRYFALVSALLATACSSAPIRSSSLSADLDSPYELPTEMCGDYFIAPVSIDGHGPFPFLLDTGAGTTLVDPELAREHDLGARLDLEIGALSVEGARARRSQMDDLSVALGRRIEGILGHPVFSDYLLTYDFDGDRIVLDAGSLSPDGEGVVPTSRGTRPFVRADVAGVSVSVLIDTGSSRGLTLTDLEDYQFSAPVTVTGARMRVDGLHLVESGRLAGTTTLGPIRLDAPVVHESVSVDLIGQGYLSRYTMTFDQRNALMRFERTDGEGAAPIPTEPVRGTGVVVAPVGDIWRVIHLDPEVEFTDAILAVGDTITSVNGRLLSEHSCADRGRTDDGREWAEYVRAGGADTLRARVRVLVR